MHLKRLSLSPAPPPPTTQQSHRARSAKQLIGALEALDAAEGAGDDVRDEDMGL